MNPPQFTPRQIATIAAALRFWDTRNLPPGSRPAHWETTLEAMAAAYGPALDTEEIAALENQIEGFATASPNPDTDTKGGD